MRPFLIIFLLIILVGCSKEQDYIGMDYRIFSNTPAWELAKAVSRDDVYAIQYQIENIGIPINYQDPKFGNTVLMNAIMNRNYKSIEYLLKLGADPNLYNDTIKNVGSNSVILASKWAVSPYILSLLLEYGGNPNSFCKGYEIRPFGKKVPFRKSALDFAAEDDVEKVKILLNAGADINRRVQGRNFPSALKGALIFNMKTTLILLENGADYNCNFAYPSDCKDDCFHSILYELRFFQPEIGSQEFEDKQKVIKFLKSKGLDYYESEIPQIAIQIAQKRYPNSWEEYLKIY